ncbi:hypothetical protein Pssp01_06770 [Pseudomonas sp. NBRC 100443]|nr:hypothetical protein Pssp01_06680 [Pseudomonas sp. NBRC 100443]GLU36584.1 hypothetical protein Pssp01_06770 [Pseudomonas sp. NBRC 100443]
MQRIRLQGSPQTLADQHRAMRAQIAANTTSSQALVESVPVPVLQLAKPVREWTTIVRESGTPWLGDAFGF